jgi:hypothetical protein
MLARNGLPVAEESVFATQLVLVRWTHQKAAPTWLPFVVSVSSIPSHLKHNPYTLAGLKMNLNMRLWLA